MAEDDFQKAERLLPRLNRTRFLEKESFRDSDVSHGEILDMWKLKRGWRFVGWAKSADVRPRTGCPYVCLFQNESSQYWIHGERYGFLGVAVRMFPSEFPDDIR